MEKPKIRVEKEDMERAETIRGALEAAHPGIRFSLASVIRLALARGFEVLVRETHDP